MTSITLIKNVLNSNNGPYDKDNSWLSDVEVIKYDVMRTLFYFILFYF